MNHIGSDDSRRCMRYSLAVPIDVIALRSGVPASIPGRTVNLSEGGVASVLAGELSPGEPVGLQFRLPLIREPIQAKAIVRHSSLMLCGVQFLAMPAEQENALRTWTQMARQAVKKPSPAVPAQPLKGMPATTDQRAKSPSRGLRWIVMSAAVAVLVLGAVAWWSWNAGWHELEEDHSVGNPAALPVDVAGSIMEQRIIHRVEPIYPPDAVQAKIQGEVTLEALIGEDGTVQDVRAVSGPDQLRSAAVDAVKWWRFEPYQVKQRAASVHTTIEVDFRLTR